MRHAWQGMIAQAPRMHFVLYAQEYQAAKDSIIKYERDLLRVFGFIVHADHPHKLLISFVKVLEGEQELYQEAWNIANDRWGAANITSQCMPACSVRYLSCTTCINCAGTHMPGTRMNSRTRHCS